MQSMGRVHGIPMATGILAGFSWKSETERFSWNGKEMEDSKGVFIFFQTSLLLY